MKLTLKKSSILALITLSIFIIILFLVFYKDNRVVINSGKTNPIVNSNSLTMMYETEFGSGEYVTSSDSAWPQEGYTFNEELSSCENGSKLTWNDETKQILLEANVSDKCYVYFDVYIDPPLTCFIAGTKIWTEDGMKNIENIKVGDKVYSYNENTKTVELKLVTKTYEHMDTNLLNINVGNVTIDVTYPHKFYTTDDNTNTYEWVPAIELTTDNYLFNAKFNAIKINKIEKYADNVKVYNFEVEDNHNYFITDDKYLVHNNKSMD